MNTDPKKPPKTKNEDKVGSEMLDTATPGN
jgi:hypothetical protein